MNKLGVNVEFDRETQEFCFCLPVEGEMDYVAFRMNCFDTIALVKALQSEVESKIMKQKPTLTLVRGDSAER